ncbi:MAG: GreA/GreB family elongation factor, partial [bacterium]
QLGEIDRRIRYLQRRLPALNVIGKVGAANAVGKGVDVSRVFFGAWVTLRRMDDAAGDEVEYRIVGGDEIDSDSRKGYISVDSPLARALLKKQVGDEVELIVADNTRRFLVRAIRYE